MIFYYYAENNRKYGKNAGAKAPADIERICEDIGGVPLNFPPKTVNKDVRILIRSTISSIKSWVKTIGTIKVGDVMLIQYPTSAIPIASMFLPLVCLKNPTIIMLIHDISYLRNRNLNLPEKEIKKYKKQDKILKYSDKLICHNRTMKDWLINEGYKGEIASLEIFDYITENNNFYTFLVRPFTVGIAGNFKPIKSGYIYKLNEIVNVTFLLYGINFNGSSHDNIQYNGSFEPDILPLKLQFSFGLVWDGNSIDTCEGSFGEYMRYNNPHKCSLYLASNIPVIIWRHAALAPFVIENGLGITISSLRELPDIFEKLSMNEYIKMKNNAINMGKKIREGYFSKRAITNFLSKGK